MNKICFIAFFFFPLFGSTQQGKPFKIRGTSNYYKDSMLIIQVGIFPLTYNDYTLANMPHDSLHLPGKMVQHGDIELEGTMHYPHPFYASYYDAKNNRGHSSCFYFLEGGDSVTITVDNLSKFHSLGSNINTKSNREYQYLKKYYSKTVDTQTGRIINMNAKQQLMKTYICAHVDSYVALWDLVFDFPYVSSDKDIQNILANLQLFSPQVKCSNTYQGFLENVKNRLFLSIGRTFPSIEVKPALSNWEAVTKNNKLTLVDFWYAHCQPCLEQLPDLKKIYQQYNEKGFTILAISIDKKEHEKDRQKVIQEFNLPWLQYWDPGGKEAKNLGIESYPSNFLVDTKGVIIKKNLSPKELLDYLEQHLAK